MTHLRRDVLAGTTVGIIALPLAMGLAIASGVAPENGLYTAIIAGILIALTGGSRFNISGPTAAFVVVLLPITSKYGLGGLATATFLAGMILTIMGLCRLGRLIEYVPYPVTIGFTSGIAVVIASLQIKDFFGLTVTEATEHFIHRLSVLAHALPTLSIWDTMAACATLAVFIGWKRAKMSIPPHLPALLAGVAVAGILSFVVKSASFATIGSEFVWQVGDAVGTGIPPFLPRFVLPWNQPGADGAPLGMSLKLFFELLGPALVIALLGALESLLCAVVADGMTHTRHNPNRELIGQGIGNMVAPFFGGIPATAAIARTAANVRSGATSRLAAIVHGVFVLLSILLLAPMLATIPLASLAALLVMVAWNMGEFHQFARIAKGAPSHDVLILFACFGLTVIFDMVIAVGIGMVLASSFLIYRLFALPHKKPQAICSAYPHIYLPEEITIFQVRGPLFFGAAQQSLDLLLSMKKPVRIVILDMSLVSMMDMTAIITLENILTRMAKRGIAVIVSGLSERLRKKLHRAGMRPSKFCLFSKALDKSLQLADSLLGPTPEPPILNAKVQLI